MNNEPKSPKNEERDVQYRTMFTMPRRETPTTRDETKTFWSNLQIDTYKQVTQQDNDKEAPRP